MGEGCIPRAGAVQVKGACKSEHIAITPGHYDLSVELRGEDLESNLTQHLSIKVQAFSDEGEEIKLHGRYKDLLISATELTATLKQPVDGRLLNGSRFVPVTLLARHYPVDGGWLPPGAKHLYIEFDYSGSGTLWLRNLQAVRSKWNFPLKERSTKVSVDGDNNRFNQSPIVALLSQGPENKQLEWLNDSLERSISDLIILELSPSSFEGTEVAGTTKQLVNKLNSSGKPWGIAYNPYWNYPEQSGSGEFEFSNQAALQGLKERLSWFFRYGAVLLLLRADDLVAHLPSGKFDYILSNKADLNRFGTLAKAHAFFINQLLEITPAQTKTYFVPPWYNTFFLTSSLPLAQSYFAELDPLIPKSVGFVWTGPSVRSLSIDSLELEGFRQAVWGRSLSLWDNTIYARRHKDFWLNRPDRGDLLSFLEPYDVKMPRYYLRQGRLGEDLVIINGYLTPFNLVQMESAYRFFKHPETYQAEATLKEILKERLGGKDRSKAIDLDSQYWKLLSAATMDPDRCTECQDIENELHQLFMQ